MERTVLKIHGLRAVEVPYCNLSHTTQTLLWEKDGFRYSQCAECGLVWVNPQLTDDSVSIIYSRGFQSKLERHRPPKNFVAYRRVLRHLEPYRQTGRLLDVGAFTGNFLLAAREAGWTAPEGTEISEAAATYARDNFGLMTHVGDLLSLSLPAGYYDAVTLSDVIEHVSDPLKTMREIHRILRPGGVVYMNTPNFASVTRWLLGQQWSVFFPWHRFYFSVPSMRLALEGAGFRVRHMSAVGVFPLSRFNPWQSFTSENRIQQATPLHRRRWLYRYRDALRPLWIGFLRLIELPFAILSLLGIHFGSTLIVYAEKEAG